MGRSSVLDLADDETSARASMWIRLWLEVILLSKRGKRSTYLIQAKLRLKYPVWCYSYGSEPKLAVKRSRGVAKNG